MSFNVYQTAKNNLQANAYKVKVNGKPLKESDYELQINEFCEDINVIN